MNKKILIIRGDKQQAKALSFILSGNGYQTRFFTDQDEALESAKNERFDLAITGEEFSSESNELDLIISLKNQQPTLPIFLITEEKNLENIINSIRAGVTDVIESENGLNEVVAQAHKYLSPNSPQSEISTSDLFEVEKMLKSLRGEDSQITVDESKLEQLQAELNETLQRNREMSKQLEKSEKSGAEAQERLEKLLANQNSENGDSNLSNINKIEDIRKKEQELSERESKIAKQKSELEIQLGDLDARKFEIDEKLEQIDTGDFSKYEEEIEALKQEKDQALLKSNERRLEQEAQIYDLQKSLEEANSTSSNSEELEQKIEELQENSLTFKEQLSEKEFIISQRDSEIEKLKSSTPTESRPVNDADLEEERRLFEIDKFKLQEKLDRFEQEKQDFENTHEKRMRELQVERRDAEISLREMQAQLKEDQLKCHVEKASFQEESRQFDQAKQNFQEDIQNLQRQQNELRVFEQRLQKMQEQLSKNEVPTSALPKAPSAMNEEIQTSASPAPSAQETGQGDSPTSWSKPTVEKQGRGPLRIGRRSAF